MDSNKKIIDSLKKYVRATNYLSAAQIFLKDNVLLERSIKPDDIKPRLLGHWGTCPGINFVYANLNYLVKKYNQDLLFVIGPGHGFPALQSNLYLEKTLVEYYPLATANEEGMKYIIKNFSWPYGFPSHSHPGSPGVILEGGELGYALSTSFGAVLDNPDLIVTCLVGDGEAETGPTATAWHLNKFLDPTFNGAVLPILHLNGYKISGPTIFGRMSDTELVNLFSGYGYEPIIVTGDDNSIYENMLASMDGAYKKIKEIQDGARFKNEKVESPKWPMIILKTEKGWTGIDEFKGKKITGNHYSHQVVVKNPRIDEEELEAVETWLRSYKFDELFDKETGFIQEILDLIPEEKNKIGKNKHALGGPQVYRPLVLPRLEDFEVKVSKPGTLTYSSMITAGSYLSEIIKENNKFRNFRFFSPDETYSNKLDGMFKNTARAFVWPHKEWDEDIANDGRVIEMLSEHSLQGLMQGYVLTGRHAIFASYEAFIQIISSMADQYAKFLNQKKEYLWRGQVPSINYILTSSGWRQDHNGFSHQNPGFIDDMLQRQGDFINVYFPADQNSILVVLEKSLSSTNGINVIVADKYPEYAWINVAQAREEIDQGVSIWNFASDENPDLVLAAAGDHLTNESLAALKIIKEEMPHIRIRFINIMTLSWSGFGSGGNVLSKEEFKQFFTEDKPVIINYHGYPQTIKQILFDYVQDPSRFEINGYNENGSTTTPFDMQIRNGTSRFNVVIDATYQLLKNNIITKNEADRIVQKYQNKLNDHREFIKKYSIDPDDITNWRWQN